MEEEVICVPNRLTCLIKHTAVFARTKINIEMVSAILSVCKNVLAKFPEEFQKVICNSSRISIIILGADDFDLWQRWKTSRVMLTNMNSNKTSKVLRSFF